MLTISQYNHFLSVAKRRARVAADAEDLLHDSLIAAVRAGRSDLSDSSNRAWFAGVIVKQAAMQARSAMRRKARENVVAADVERNARRAPRTRQAADELEHWLARLARLSKSSRTIATLALYGMTRAEISFALNLSDSALRQRLTALRRALRDAGLLDDPASFAGISTASGPRGSIRRTIGSHLHLGVLRRALLAVVQRRQGVGTHDPDGHLFVIARASQDNSGSQSRQRRQR